MELKTHPNVYEPREDSILLQSVLQKKVFSDVHSVLDVCTGSGILAITCAAMYPRAKITGVDINPDAVGLATRNARLNTARCEFIESDLFSLVCGTFDLIVCNPPYLPAQAGESADGITTALVGGKSGYEVILRIITEASRFLSDNGRLLLLFSSLSKKDVIDKALRESVYEYSQLACKDVGMMETLYVYEIRKLPIVAQLTKKGITNVAFFAHGKRGIVLCGDLKDKKIAVKLAKNTIQQVVVEKELLFLRKANELGIGPKVIDFAESYIIMDFVEGTLINDFLKNASVADAKKVIVAVLHQLHTLDVHRIQKLEMTNPYKHIIVSSGNKPVLIDFERAVFATYPKNVTQFIQYLRTSKSPVELLVSDEELITSTLQEYKTKQDLKKVLELLK